MFDLGWSSLGAIVWAPLEPLVDDCLNTVGPLLDLSWPICIHHVDSCEHSLESSWASVGPLIDHLSVPLEPLVGNLIDHFWTSLGPLVGGLSSVFMKIRLGMYWRPLGPLLASLFYRRVGNFGTTRGPCLYHTWTSFALLLGQAFVVVM